MSVPSTVYLYRFYCNTEATFVQDWNISVPTVCPNNSGHSIDSTTMTILDKITRAQVEVIPQVGTTGGQYRAQSVSFTIPANTTGTYSNVWPYDISVKTVSFNTIQAQQGDVINSLIAPNTIVGVLTSPVAIGDTVINVSSTATAISMKGFLFAISDGTNTANLQEIVDIGTSTITCHTASTFAFAAGSVVMVTVNNIRDFVIGPAGPVHLQASGSTAAVIPANTTVLVTYQNNQSVSTVFNYNFEFFY